MKKFFLDPWLFVAALVIFIAVAGPWLISAQSTIAVLLGIVILIALFWWGWRVVRTEFDCLCINPTRHKGQNKP